MIDPMNQRMKLADYEPTFAFYDALDRQRGLTEQESKRVAQLVARYKQSLLAKAWREANPDKTAASRKKWAGKAKNKKKQKVYKAAWHADNKATSSRRAREWKEANPDRVQAASKKLQRKREAMRAFALLLGYRLTAKGLRALTVEERGQPLMLPAPLHPLGLNAPLDRLDRNSWTTPDVVKRPAVEDQKVWHKAA
jgi:hypothetical protein